MQRLKITKPALPKYSMDNSIPFQELTHTAVGNHEYSERFLRHRNYQFWMSCITMNSIFGPNYVEIPKIPYGYESEAHAFLAKQNNNH